MGVTEERGVPSMDEARLAEIAAKVEQRWQYITRHTDGATLPGDIELSLWEEVQDLLAYIHRLTDPENVARALEEAGLVSQPSDAADPSEEWVADAHAFAATDAARRFLAALKAIR